MTESADRMRLDKWLWAARFYKTRALAVAAIDGGKVKVNDGPVKRARLVQIGDEVRLRQGPYEYRVTVRGLNQRRGPAAEAAAMYYESDESKAARETLALQMRSVAPLFRSDQGRPTKRDRRRIERFKRGE